MTTTPAPPLDDFDTFLAEQLRDPGFAAAYADAQNASRTCLDLIAARKAADVTPTVLASRIAEQTGMSLRRARRWVRRYESGELTHNVPLWLLHVYGRAVGARVRVDVENLRG